MELGTADEIALRRDEATKPESSIEKLSRLNELLKGEEELKPEEQKEWVSLAVDLLKEQREKNPTLNQLAESLNIPKNLIGKATELTPDKIEELLTEGVHHSFRDMLNNTKGTILDLLRYRKPISSLLSESFITPEGGILPTKTSLYDSNPQRRLPDWIIRHPEIADLLAPKILTRQGSAELTNIKPELADLRFPVLPETVEYENNQLENPGIIYQIPTNDGGQRYFVPLREICDYTGQNPDKLVEKALKDYPKDKPFPPVILVQIDEKTAETLLNKAGYLILGEDEIRNFNNKPEIDKNFPEPPESILKEYPDRGYQPDPENDIFYNVVQLANPEENIHDSAPITNLSPNEITRLPEGKQLILETLELTPSGGEDKKARVWGEKGFAPERRYYQVLTLDNLTPEEISQLTEEQKEGRKIFLRRIDLKVAREILRNSPDCKIINSQILDSYKSEEKKPFEEEKKPDRKPESEESRKIEFEIGNTIYTRTLTYTQNGPQISFKIKEGDEERLVLPQDLPNLEIIENRDKNGSISSRFLKLDLPKGFTKDNKPHGTFSIDLANSVPLSETVPPELIDYSRLFLYHLSRLNDGEAVTIKLPPYDLRKEGKPRFTSNAYEPFQKIGGMFSQIFQNLPGYKNPNIVEGENNLDIKISDLVNSEGQRIIITIKKTQLSDGKTQETIEFKAVSPEKAEELKRQLIEKTRSS